MKVTFLKPHKMGSNSFKEGDNAIIITSLAEELIEEGICEVNKSVTLRDAIVANQENEVAQVILDQLPEKATDIVSMIPAITNRIALEHLAKDKRITISDAAEAQLDELD